MLVSTAEEKFWEFEFAKLPLAVLLVKSLESQTVGLPEPVESLEPQVADSPEPVESLGLPVEQQVPWVPLELVKQQKAPMLVEQTRTAGARLQNPRPW